MAMVYTETPNFLHEILLFIPLVWVEAPSLIQNLLRALVCISKSGILAVTGQGVYKVGVFPRIPTEVSVNTNKDETITGRFRFWSFGDFLSHLLTLLVHTYCLGNKQLWDEGWDISHWDMLPTWFYLDKWSISVNVFTAQTLTDFRKNCTYRESLNLTRHWETCKPLGRYCDVGCQSRVNEMLPIKLYPKAST